MIKRILAIIIFLACALSFSAPGRDDYLEPFTYQEDFESCELNAWASYPLWQDTAYDPNLRPGPMVPGDPNISLVQKVTPYARVDNYAGAQKLLDAILTPGSTLSLRFYLKTHLQPEFIKVRLAAGDKGALDFTIPNPPSNRWQKLTIQYDDFSRQNPDMKNQAIKIYALAVLAKFPEADPAMPIYFGLDDVSLQAQQAAHFKFSEPRMVKLAEWRPWIAERHYRKGDLLTVRGKWPFPASRVEMEIALFTKGTETIARASLKKKNGDWVLDRLKLVFPEGLYLAKLRALAGTKAVAETEFSFYIAPQDIGRKHPRLWFDKEKMRWVKSRLQEERFKSVREEILNAAREAREKYPVDKIVFDLDQLPDDEPLLGNVPRSIYPWFDRITPWRKGVFNSAFAFALLDDQAAGDYGKALLVKLCQFPYWVHPWFPKRGQHIYYPVGELGMDIALGYDLLFDLFDENERKIIRQALFKNIILACHQSYVEDNLVTSNTSNWVAHITSGSLMAQAAIYGDGDEIPAAEPYLTGVIFKLNELIHKAFGRDGGYGESLGYNNFTMLSLSKALPAAENVFHIDLSENLNGKYSELIWAGQIKNKYLFYFGDSPGELMPLTNWAWLLAKNKDGQLSWLYNFLKKGETLMDAIYEIEKIPQKEPFPENPVRVYRDLGTTVFKSGWEKEDFAFVMRTGAFFNHQHLDQGTFWLADRGSLFIEERHGSTYYDDPIYQSHYIQPIAHSTILIDHNPQSQRAGDPLRFAKGFDDRAFIFHFLDGAEAAFSSGDIGRLYWGKVKELRRNVLYLKPRTLLMLDTILPAEKDADITCLFQTGRLEEIQAGQKLSSITIGKNTLQIMHLAPEELKVEALEFPHFLHTLKNEYPLKKEGMLTVTGRTNRKPLVIASLLATISGEEEEWEYRKGDGFGAGNTGGKQWAFSTEPGRTYGIGDITTDALAITWGGERIFAALCTSLKKQEKVLIQSPEPVTCELSDGAVKYYLAKEAQVSFGLAAKPGDIRLNGQWIKNWRYDSKTGCLCLHLPAGEGLISALTIRGGKR